MTICTAKHDSELVLTLLNEMRWRKTGHKAKRESTQESTFSYLDVWSLEELSAWLLGPDLDVVRPDMGVVDHQGVQPEGFPSLFLDVGDLRARLDCDLDLNVYLDVEVL